MSLHASVRSWWQGEAGPAGALLRLLAAPFEGLFRIAVALRGRLYDSGLIEAQTAEIPVISVGNLTVGGTGKTPIVRWIVEQLREMEQRPAVIVRGFADEVALHRRWYPSVPVVEDASRVRGTATAAAGGCTVAVLDDGFQHRRLARDLDVVVVAISDGGPVRMLPRGPYRESPKALRRADLILISSKGGTQDPDIGTAVERARAWAARWAPQVPVHRITLAAGPWQHLDGSGAEPPAGPLLAVAGIGAPETFAATLKQALGLKIEVVAFQDHQRYDHADVHSILQQAKGRTIIVTEKDAVKLARFPRLHDVTRVLSLRVGDVEHPEELTRLIRGVVVP